MKKQLLQGTLFAATLFTGVIAQTEMASAMSFIDLRAPGFSTFEELVIPFGPNGETVTITANEDDDSSAVGLDIGDSRFVSQGIGGVGAFAGFGSGDDPDVDGFGPDEVLSFQFSAPVRLTGLDFFIDGGPDSFFEAVFGDGGVEEASLFIDNDFIIAGPLPVFFFETPAVVSSVTGTLFQFGVTDFGDDFGLTALEVEIVPTPALLPGLLGMGAALLRKRRKESAEINS